MGELPLYRWMSQVPFSVSESDEWCGLRSQESQVSPAYQVKEGAKWIICGGMPGRGLTNLFVPQGQIFTANCYINKILNNTSLYLAAIYGRRTRGEKAVQLQ